MDDPEEIAENLYTVNVRIGGAIQKTFVVEGIYEDDGGAWSDEVNAVNASEACFQAEWIMAGNAWGTVEMNIGPATTPEQSIERLASVMKQHKTFSAELRSPT